MELWTHTRSLPNLVRRAATRAEAEGWSGLAFSDSQNRSGDPYVAMGVAATITSRIQLSTGVTNPFTRHPAVTASAISSVQAASEGRAALGIGRGDSSLAHLGLAPASVPVFRTYLDQLATYLRGGSVPITDVGREGFARLDDRIPLAKVPSDSRIEWLGPLSVPTVPLWVVASGPKVIRTAAAIADRVVLAVGADPEKIAWGIREARAVQPGIAIGAFVNVLVGDDRDQLRTAAAGAVAGMARFGAMHGKAVGPVTTSDRAALESIPAHYDMTRHFDTANDAAQLSSEFVDRYAILGPASHVVERFLELAELGVDRFHILGPSQDIERDLARRLHREFVEGVLPRVAGAVR